MKIIYIILALVFTLVGCAPKESNADKAQALLQKTIQAHGGKQFFNSTISFDLKELKYHLERRDNISNFTVTRQADSTQYKATYENGYGSYFINDSLQEETLYSRRFLDSRVEGFVYLLSFPFVLDQNSIILEQKEDVLIRRKNYHVLRATVREVDDFISENEFYLYINAETFIIEFTAERFDLVGDRKVFRRNFNERQINGLHFFDSYLYRPKKMERALDSLYLDYDIPNMEPLKSQELTNINVELHQN